MVALAFYNYSHLSALHYQLDEVQGRFTTTADLALSRISHRNIQGDFSARSVTVLYNGRAVGFFVLDFGKDKLDFTEDDDSVLLRSLSVNPEFQGRGIGREAMELLPLFVKKFYPGTAQIVLAVNKDNHSAFRLYQKCGYIFEGKTRPGISGTQLLMYRNI